MRYYKLFQLSTKSSLLAGNLSHLVLITVVGTQNGNKFKQKQPAPFVCAHNN